MFKRLALAAFSAFTALSTPTAHAKVEKPKYHQVDNSEAPCDTAIHTFRDGTQARAVECIDQHDFNSGKYEETRDEFLATISSTGEYMDETEAQEIQRALEAMDPMTFALIRNSIAHHAPRYGFDPSDIDPEVIFAIGVAESKLARANKGENAESWTGCQGWGQFTQRSWKSNLVLNADRIDTLTGPNTAEWLGKLTPNNRRSKVDTGLLTREEKREMLNARNNDALNIDATVELNLRNAKYLGKSAINPETAPELYWMHSEGPSYKALIAHVKSPTIESYIKSYMALAKFQRDNTGYKSLQHRYETLKAAGLKVQKISKEIKKSGGLPDSVTLMPQAEIKERELDDLRDYVAEEVAKLRAQDIKDREIVVALDDQKEEESIQGPGKSQSNEPMRDSLQRGPVRSALHGITVFKNTPTHKKFLKSSATLKPVLDLAQKDESFHRILELNIHANTLGEYIKELRTLSDQGMDAEFDEQLDDFEALTAHLAGIGVKKSEIWTGPERIDYSWVATVIDKFSANTFEMPEADTADIEDAIELKMPEPEIIETDSAPVEVIVEFDESDFPEEIQEDVPNLQVAVLEAMVEEYDDEDDDEDDLSAEDMANFEVKTSVVSKLKHFGKKLFSRWF